MLLTEPIEHLARTSFVTIKKLKGLNINNYWDLLNYFPFRYEDYSIISTIDKLQEGETVTIKGIVTEIKPVFTKSRLNIQKVKLTDQTGIIELIWYNQPYLLRLLKKNSYLSVSGVAERFLHILSIKPQEFEMLFSPDQETIHTGRIIPVYSEKLGLSSKTIREKIYSVLQQINNVHEIISEILPKKIIKHNNLITEAEAYHHVHFPSSIDLQHDSRKRLAFDELFTIQLSAQLTKREWGNESILKQLIINQKKINLFISTLPFKLTNAQKRCVNEILTDMSLKKPMNRLLQGDVGSGKTIIAAIAAYATYLNNLRTLIMVPTEILAEQHFKSFINIFKTIGIPVGLQTGSTKLKNMQDYSIIIGTHALISKGLSFQNIGLAIVDEQHRFGVEQRAALKSKGINSHMLTMTATPIPRTVLLTLYGELDLSVLDEMPSGRIPVKTYLVPQEKRQSGYQWIQKKIQNEHIQTFIICPLIEVSESETMRSIKAAKHEFEHLKHIFPNLRLALLHGRMKAKDKNKIMNEFKNKKYDILVTTPVVEVGIDIPNATIILIEAAERFGLAQLHQLRGRVGRGKVQSYCFLLTEKTDKYILDRLQFFSKTKIGIKLSEYDLKKRGPGDLYGTKQHGYIDLKIASFHDIKLIEQARNAAGYFLHHYTDFKGYPELKKRINKIKNKDIIKN